ncbi:MAG: N-acetyltransferase [Candidatus Acidiferrales bacterium]
MSGSAVKFALRDYKPDDFDTLYEIDQACYEPGIACSKRDMRAYLQFPGVECILAETPREITGFCISARQRTRGYIVTIDVLQKYRKIGIGSALLREVERRLAANGVREVGLETATDNESAIAFWNKHGYRTLGVAKGYYPGGRDAFAMTKILVPRARASKEGR